MRRPDLPLIILVLIVGAGLAVFVDGGAPPALQERSGAEAGGASTDPIDSFLADFDPVFVDCFGGDLEASDGEDADPADAAAVVEQVSARVERLRELRFSEPVNARLLARPVLARRLSELLKEELPQKEVALEGEVLEVLGAIPPGSDLYAITEEALGSQVIGLYDTETRELLVQANGDPAAPGRTRAGSGHQSPSAPSEDAAGSDVAAKELITLAHELEHALADQALGLRERIGGPAAVDRQLAYASVVEGDATLTMELYALAYVGLAEQLSLGGSVPGEEKFDALPDYVQRSLLFPYLEGLRLVCHRWVAGGWNAVDGLYARPPTGTDQVIFPERYGDGAPANPRDPGRPGGGWKLRSHRELGAGELEWLFYAPGGNPEAGLPEPRRLVFGWSGGELELWGRGEERALGIALEESPGSNVLCGALGAWYRAGWPEAELTPGAEDTAELTFSEPGRSALLVCDGREVRMGIGPDREAAALLAL